MSASTSTPSTTPAPAAGATGTVIDEPSLTKQCIAEGAGVFFLVMCVLVATAGQGWLIGVGLVAIIAVFGPAAGGGHFNPAVTAVAYAKKDCDGKVAISKVVAQVLGGLLAFVVWYSFYGMKKAPVASLADSASGQAATAAAAAPSTGMTPAATPSAAFAF